MADNDKKAGAKVTAYVVLKRIDEEHVSADGTTGPDGIWGQGATIEAVNAKAAIRAALDGDGTYIAVPARSFLPVSVTTETVEKVSLG